MSPHLVESAAKAQLDDRYRSAERRRLAGQGLVSRSASAAGPARHRRLRSFRAVVG
jgi:hypothetical protein